MRFHNHATLYNEIMVDEIGHVFYARTRTGKFGLWVAKKIQSAVTNSIISDLTEFTRLVSKEKLVATVGQVEQILNGNEEWLVKPLARPIALVEA